MINSIVVFIEINYELILGTHFSRWRKKLKMDQWEIFVCFSKCPRKTCANFELVTNFFIHFTDEYVTPLISIASIENSLSINQLWLKTQIFDINFFVNVRHDCIVISIFNALVSIKQQRYLFCFKIRALAWTKVCYSNYH